MSSPFHRVARLLFLQQQFEMRTEMGPNRALAPYGFTLGEKVCKVWNPVSPGPGRPVRSVNQPHDRVALGSPIDGAANPRKTHIDVIDVLWSRPVDLENIVQDIVGHLKRDTTVAADFNGQINVPGQECIVPEAGHCINFRSSRTRNTFGASWLSFRAQGERPLPGQSHE